MTGMRAPVVAGVGGGVGTTTVAVALRGHDAGRLAGLPPGRWPDILVCRGTLDSLRRAAVALDEIGPEPPPVLAVTLVGRPPRGSLRTRLDLLEADAAALVRLPRVGRWATLVDPLAEAAQLLVEPEARLPRPARAYATALRELATAVAATGRLGPADPALRPGRDERHFRPIGSDDRAARRRSTSSAPPASQPAFRPADPDDRHSRRTGSDDRPPRRENGAATGPLARADPRRPRRGVQIVAAGRIEQAG